MDLENYFANVEEAAAWLESRVALKPRVVVILTAGLHAFADALSERQEIPYEEIPHFPRPRAEGHEGRLLFGRHAGVGVAAMVGRFHHYEGLSPQEVVFPLFVLAKLGAQVLVTTNAVGGIKRSFRPGDIMLVQDHINMMGVNPLAGIAVQRKSHQFTSMVEAYDPGLRNLARLAAKGLSIDLKGGVYVASCGPSYETKAEICAFRAMGADAVGMSTVPEVIAANFLGMRCLSFSCIANAATDHHEGAMTHAEVLEAMHALSPRMVSLLQRVVEEIGRDTRDSKRQT